MKTVSKMFFLAVALLLVLTRATSASIVLGHVADNLVSGTNAYLRIVRPPVDGAGAGFVQLGSFSLGAPALYRQ